MSLIAPPNRRRLILGLTGTFAAPLVARAESLMAIAPLDPFALGVASGEPWPDGFVIWTRLCYLNFPYNEEALPGPRQVGWEVAEDDTFTRIARRGSFRTDPRHAHAVHVELAGLKPDRPYWYRFEALGARSPTGRARTAPVPTASPTNLKLAVASCSNWEAGYFSAYRHMAAEGPDLTLFLGDYIYESSHGVGVTPLRAHYPAGEVADLAGYRARYSQYKTDPDLQALHAAAPALVTWDDHEVHNDYSGDYDWDPRVTVEAFRRRRTAAYQAFWENMPLRRRSQPGGPFMRIHDRFRWGQLATIHMADSRQYRDASACARPETRRGFVAAPDCVDINDPARSILGAAQEAWLNDGFKRSESQWNIIGQGLMVAPFLQRNRATGWEGHYTDTWDGYPKSRDRVLAGLGASGARNPVFFSGDIHCFWANDLVTAQGPVATEFVGTSVTSDPPPPDNFRPTLDKNPWVRFFEDQYRGYICADVTAERMEVRFQAISDRRDPKATVSTLQSFVVESGKAGVIPG